MPHLPELEYVRGACPQCGAATRSEAHQRCLGNRDECGEPYCLDNFEDGMGFALTPTTACLDAIDEYWDRQSSRQAR